jgi:hypothetical protein
MIKSFRDLQLKTCENLSIVRSTYAFSEASHRPGRFNF